MRNATLSAILLQLLLSYRAIAQDSDGNGLVLSTSRPQAGDEIHFTYTPSGKLVGDSSVQAALFYYLANHWNQRYAKDISVSKGAAATWSGSFTLPDSVVAFALRFKSAGLVDDNSGRGYISLIYNHGNTEPNAYYGAALLYGNSYWSLGFTRPDTSLVLFRKGFQLCPEGGRAVESYYYETLASEGSSESFELIDERLQYLLHRHPLHYEDYQFAIELANLRRNRRIRDSLYADAARLFPSSQLAMSFAENRFYATDKLDSQQLLLADFVRRFPIADSSGPAGRTYTAFCISLAKSFIQLKDYGHALFYTGKLVEYAPFYKAFLYNVLTKNVLNDSLHTGLQLADSLSRLAVETMEWQLEHPQEFMTPFKTQADWKDERRAYFQADDYEDYAQVLDLEGKKEEAVFYERKAIGILGDDNLEANEHFLAYLLKNKALSEAIATAERYIRKEKYTRRIIDLYKEAYVDQHGSDQGWEASVEMLKTSTRKRIRDDLRKEKMSVVAAPFTLYDLSGRPVSLLDLKGKVVILDFWATWCGPCKASFSAMNQAVDKFKNDTDVVFLFINTLESSQGDERKKQVSRILADKQYPFRVLLDSMVNVTNRTYDVINRYRVDGIPTKFIIGRDGRTMFKSVGFDGNEEQLLAELTEMIRMAKGQGLTIQEKWPQAGNIIQFSYSPNDYLEKDSNLICSLFYFNANGAEMPYSKFLPIHRSQNGEWNGSFKLPDSATCFALSFRDGVRQETNDCRGYISLVYKNQLPVPYACLYAGLFHYQLASSLLGIAPNADSALTWVQQELNLYPQESAFTEYHYYEMLLNAKGKVAYPEINERINKLLQSPDPSVLQYKRAIALAGLKELDQQKDSLYKVAASRFPKSDMPLLAIENEMGAQEDVRKALAGLVAFRKKFGIADASGQVSRIRSEFYLRIARLYLRKSDYRKAMKYALRVSAPQSATYVPFVFEELVEKILDDSSGRDLPLADSAARIGIHKLEKQIARLKKDTLNEQIYKWWQAYEPFFYDINAQVLSREGHYRKAAMFEQRAVDSGRGQNPKHNERLIGYLLKSGEHNLLIAEAKRFIREGLSTTTIVGYFKQEYLAQHGSLSGFEACLDSLSSEAFNKMRAAIVLNKISEPAKPFELPDLNGKKVSLDALKGKVVVIDFWATWCHSCVSALPAMQKLVKSFKSDTNVVFLFIDTWEVKTGDDLRRKLIAFLETNHYSVDVLIDSMVNPETRKYLVVDSYGVDGIPAGFIIDPNGDIVFRVAEEDNNDEEKTIVEMAEMIRVAKG